MNKIKKTIANILIIAILTSNIVMVHAENTGVKEIKNVKQQVKLFTLYDCVNNLVAQGICDDVTKKLNEQPTREKAVQYIQNLSCGDGDNYVINRIKNRDDKLITAKEYIAMILNVLGYKSTEYFVIGGSKYSDYNDNNVMDLFNKTITLDAKTSYEVQNEKFSYKHLIYITHKALLTQMKDSPKTLIDYIIFKGKGDIEKALQAGLVSSDSIMNTKVSKFYKSSNYSDEYVTIECTDTNKVILNVKIKDKDKKWLRIQYVNNDRITSKMVRSNKEGKIQLDITKDLDPGINSITFYKGYAEYGRYTSWLMGIKVEKKDRTFSIPLPYEPIYKYNIEKYYYDRSEYALEALTKPSFAIQSNDEKIVKLGKEITKDCVTDYDKVFAIYEWVKQNIYYNIDGLVKGIYGDTDAVGTLENKKSVCQGYASLTAALIRSVGIPCSLVRGYALGAGMVKKWDEESVSHGTNHAWNEAFVDGRWIIIDTTWDTFNRYRDGKFKQGKQRYNYFDVTLEQFSRDHRIEKRDNY